MEGETTSGSGCFVQKSMRIVYFAHSVLNRGGDKMVLAHLGHLAGSGHEVAIRSNVVDTVFAIHPAIRIEKPSFCSKLGTLVSAALERQQADCVIASIVPTALLLFFRNRGRVLHFAQDDNETVYRSHLLRFLMRSLYFWAFSVFRIPTIAVSQTLADVFEARFSADCRVVGNGVDTGVFFPLPSVELIAAKEERKAILVLSRNDHRKGFDLARQVVALVAASVQTSFEVWTVGEKVEWGVGFPRHRDFGNVTENALREIMSSADVFLYPSRSEGFGLMVLEAFACHCPVLTSTAISFARDNDNALVAPVSDVESLADRLERLLVDEPLARRIADAGYLFAQRYRLNDSQMLFESEITGLFPGTREQGATCKEVTIKK